MKWAILFWALLPAMLQASTLEAGPLLGDLRHHAKAGGYAEYRWGQAALQPQASLYGGEHSRIYGALGAAYTRPWAGLDWTISVNVGVFNMEGRNVLGNPIEFLSYLQVARHLTQRCSIAVAIAHISNAHLGRINPGSELIRIGLRWRL